jgi:hypothetical protein
MTILKKYNSIDQTKIPKDVSDVLKGMKSKSKNFTVESFNEVFEPQLDKIIISLKEKHPESIKGDSEKKKTTPIQTFPKVIYIFSDLESQDVNNHILRLTEELKKYKKENPKSNLVIVEEDYIEPIKAPEPKSVQDKKYDFIYEVSNTGGSRIKTYFELPTDRSIKFIEESDNIKGLRYYKATDKGLETLKSKYPNNAYGDKQRLSSKDLINKLEYGGDIQDLGIANSELFKEGGEIRFTKSDYDKLVNDSSNSYPYYSTKSGNKQEIFSESTNKKVGVWKDEKLIFTPELKTWLKQNSYGNNYEKGGKTKNSDKAIYVVMKRETSDSPYEFVSEKLMTSDDADTYVKNYKKENPNTFLVEKDIPLPFKAGGDIQNLEIANSNLFKEGGVLKRKTQTLKPFITLAKKSKNGAAFYSKARKIQVSNEIAQQWASIYQKDNNSITQASDQFVKDVKSGMYDDKKNHFAKPKRQTFMNIVKDRQRPNEDWKDAIKRVKQEIADDKK